MSKTTYHCPKCDSMEVTTEHHQMFMVNTGEHYCHRTKTYDADSRATCLDCDWVGSRYELKKEKNNG